MQDPSAAEASGHDARAIVAFDRPPVVETVLGVQFARLSGWTNAHNGLLWRQLAKDWPHATDDSLLEPVYERFDEVGAWSRSGTGLALKISKDCSSRLCVRNTAKDRMIQIQNGRFHYNWLGSPDAGYPSYRRLRPEFVGRFESLGEFLVVENLGSVQPDQWEVTYLNQILKGTVWQSPEDWRALFPSLPMPVTCTEAVSLERFDGQWHFIIGNNEGRLHVAIRQGLVGPAGQDEALLLQLTARGPVGTGEDAVESGLDLGHDAIVRSFVALTSDEARAYWGQNK